LLLFVKDANGQLRCAMFRRAASLLDFSPRDGELVELRGRLGVYEARGDLQFIVEACSARGRAPCSSSSCVSRRSWSAKACSTTARKRPLPLQPRGIGLVTSLGRSGAARCGDGLAPPGAAHSGGAGAGAGAGGGGAAIADCGAIETVSASAGRAKGQVPIWLKILRLT
jgi:hypothetical protein